MARGLVLSEVPLLCGDKRSACPARSYPALRAQAQGRLVRTSRWSEMNSRSYALS
jgi:hypothetical protein